MVSQRDDKFQCLAEVRHPVGAEAGNRDVLDQGGVDDGYTSNVRVVLIRRGVQVAGHSGAVTINSAVGRRSYRTTGVVVGVAVRLRVNVLVAYVHPLQVNHAADFRRVGEAISVGPVRLGKGISDRNDQGVSRHEAKGAENAGAE